MRRGADEVDGVGCLVAFGLCASFWGALALVVWWAA